MVGDLVLSIPELHVEGVPAHILEMEGDVVQRTAGLPVLAPMPFAPVCLFRRLGLLHQPVRQETAGRQGQAAARPEHGAPAPSGPYLRLALPCAVLLPGITCCRAHDLASSGIMPWGIAASGLSSTP